MFGRKGKVRELTKKKWMNMKFHELDLSIPFESEEIYSSDPLHLIIIQNVSNEISYENENFFHEMCVGLNS